MTRSTSLNPRIKTWRTIGWVLIGIVVMGIGFVTLSLFPPGFYLPHKKPVLILPIPPEYDIETNITPMGEKIFHPGPGNGHCGIDFGYTGLTEKVPFIAAMDGVVSKVHFYPFKDAWIDENTEVISWNVVDVIIVKGVYQVVYSEMDGDSLPATIRVGARIKQGDLVGYGNMTGGLIPGTFFEMIHWEFGSISPLIDRFCPLTYFTDESQVRLEEIWAHTDFPEMKAQYPLICNGWYEGKVER